MMLSEIISTLFQRRFVPAPRSGGRPIAALCEALLSETGDIATIGIGRQILAAYAAMEAPEKAGFFAFLATALDVDGDAVERLAREYRGDPSAGRLAALSRAVEPKRQELLRRLNRIAGATARLVAMRCDLFEAMTAEPAFARIDRDFEHLLSSWFNPGFLVLKRIGWDSPANILEKIIEYEAVHAIDDWDDLRRRVQPADRRCFAYFHPSMPEEPLIFVEVALCDAVPGSIHAVLAPERTTMPPEQATTAVFYSISNCQPGLRGVSFGNSLIKQVVETLSLEFPHLSTFVTLSPIPGFRAWLEDEGEAAAAPESRCALAARYLLTAKRPDGFPRDSVARFHLANGALVQALHADADRSGNGLRQSHGVMVNYLYDLKRLEPNIGDYFTNRQVAHSAKVGDLLKSSLRVESL